MAARIQLVDALDQEPWISPLLPQHLFGALKRETGDAIPENDLLCRFRFACCLD
jgi:hypothetical protein